MSKGASKKEQFVAGLDIGTTKVAVVVGSVGEKGLEIIGIGRAPNSGMRQGTIVDIESTIEAIQVAREEAELMAGVELSEMWVGVSGSHIQSFDSKGMVAISEQEVQDYDVGRVIEAAKAIATPSERQVIHVLPREFKVDEQGGISDPVGMAGVRLEASVHIITGSKAVLSNIRKCTERAGLKVAGYVLQPLASALAVLSDDEKDLGVALVDMGGGTSDVIIYLQGSVAFTSVVPIGGRHFTHDIAVGLRAPQNCAEDLKKKFGCALAYLADEGDNIEVEGVGGRHSRTVPRRHLCEVIEPRAEETLLLIQKALLESGHFELLGSGVVLTGGASQLTGLVEMAEFLYDVPVRGGRPARVAGVTDIVHSPSFATGIGLLRYGLGQLKSRHLESRDDAKVGRRMAGWARKVKDIFGGSPNE